MQDDQASKYKNDINIQIVQFSHPCVLSLHLGDAKSDDCFCWDNYLGAWGKLATEVINTLLEYFTAGYNIKQK
ncbi:MAG: hypothetical protein ACRC1W_12480 [Shewanella sp.]